MKNLIACLCAMALVTTVSAAEPWKTTVLAKATPAKKGYDCGCHGQGNCVCGDGCACVPYLTMKKKADCGCAVSGECSCAPGTCTCPSCATKTVKTELDEYAAAHARALSEGKHLIVCVGFCRADLKALPGVVGCCAINDSRFADVTPGTLVVGRNEAGKLTWAASLPGNASVVQVLAVFNPPVQQQAFYAPPPMMFGGGGFGGGFGGGGGGCRGGG